MSEAIEVVAHRGASEEEPEHSLAAYLLAVKQGADAIECDVRLTRDGQLVCHHDRNINRTSTGRAVVSASTLDELEQHDFSMGRAGDDPSMHVMRSKVLTLRSLIEAMLEACPAVFSFTFGLAPPAVLEACRARNILTMGTATTLEEVVALEQSGVDAICVQGMEAGGHRGTFLKPVEDSLVGLISLLGLAVQATRLPVIAAGGIMNGQGIRAVLDLGASAASLGTAFMVVDEAGTPPVHQHMLAEADPRPTVLTRAFSGRMARGLTNRFHETIHPHQNKLVPFPALNDLTRKIRQAAATANDPEALSLWAGQAYPLVRPMATAQLMTTLVSEARL